MTGLELWAALLGPMSATGALVGLGAGLGALVIVMRVPWRRAPHLEDRLAPYIQDVATGQARAADVRLLGGGVTGGARVPFAVLERLLAPVMADASRWAARISGGSATIRRRLDGLARPMTVEQFRAEQVVCGLLGALAGTALALGIAAARGLEVVPLVGLVVVGGLCGVLGREHLLGVQLRRREERMVEEFPAIAELLALSVGAGEGAIGALERVSRTCRGELSVELRRTLADARTGTPLVHALEGLARRTSLPALARFVDGVAVAVERGTPLADVLRAQAQDVREGSRRRLMESGGRKEILMMVPVVFLVLPVTVLFAVYPGLAVLDLTF